MRLVLINVLFVITIINGQYNQGPMGFGPPPPMNMFGNGFGSNTMGQQGQDGSSGSSGQFNQFGSFGRQGYGFMQGNQGMQCQMVCKDNESDQNSEGKTKAESTTPRI